MITSPNHSPDRGKPATAYGFTETRWSLVTLASDKGSRGSREALAKLCEDYWHPIYSFLRRKGHNPHDAEDLTQQFFVRLLTKSAFASADRTKGRFRNFLLGALKKFAIDEYRRSTSLKRGGKVLPFDLEEAEKSYRDEPDSSLTPEQVYDRRWSAKLLDAAYIRLLTEFQAAGQTDRFEKLKEFLSCKAASGDYDRVGNQLNITAQATKKAVHRMRQRYRQLVRAEVSETLEDNADLETEFNYLFGQIS
ncbi:sigma-70 family RNA polymerase sigma factor [bacterium]|nr:sigma-70 family RNA polymerase sigma factor [bacterium]